MNSDSGKRNQEEEEGIEKWSRLMKLNEGENSLNLLGDKVLKNLWEEEGEKRGCRGSRVFEIRE